MAERLTITYLLTGQLQIFDNLTEGDNLIPEEVGELLVCTSRSPHNKDVSDPGCVHIAGLGEALTRAKWMRKYRVLHLVAFEGRATSGTEASPLVVVQNFAEKRHNKVVVVVARAEELGDEAVRRPGIGLAMEVRDEVELGERVAMTSEVVKTFRVDAAGALRSANDVAG